MCDAMRRGDSGAVGPHHPPSSSFSPIIMSSSSSTSASCRIVIVSSSLETAKQVAHRIKAVSGESQTQSSSPPSEIIHWTIKNKYYTAPVHFHPIHLEGLPSIELDEVPAIIYAWKENEPYKEHMKLVSEQTATFKPEVSLAVNMAPTTDEELEDFFFEHGFEYVSGQQTQSGEQSPSLADSSTIPGITRAVDSLSTIMWPSMVRNEPNNPKFAAKLTLPPEGDDDIDAHLLSLLSDSGGQSNKQHQMELLERWLEQDNDDYESLGTYSRGIRHGNNNDDYDDYASLYSHAHSVSTTAAKSDDPWATGGGGISLSDTLESDQHIGFDDDFTDFVSAPAAVTGRQENEERDEDEDEDEDAGLPSREEIRAAGARIFGERMSIPESGSAPFYVLPDEPEHGNRNLDGDGGAEETEEGLEMDAPAFDLTRILGALEGMKEEIAQISDEQERRRAAAKVTLGLVYGLENMGDETADNK